MARTGKIARLPKEVREELNQRLQNGEVAVHLVDWLNGLEKVKTVLAANFGGQPISESNLTGWRAGGYLDWEQKQELERLRQMTGRAARFGEVAAEQEISDSFATLLSVEMTGLARTLLDKESDPEKRWKRLCQVHKQISRLRRDDHRKMRTLINWNRWQRETDSAEKELKQPELTPLEKAERIKQIYGNI